MGNSGPWSVHFVGRLSTTIGDLGVPRTAVLANGKARHPHLGTGCRRHTFLVAFGGCDRLNSPPVLWRHSLRGALNLHLSGCDGRGIAGVDEGLVEAQSPVVAPEPPRRHATAFSIGWFSFFVMFAAGREAPMRIGKGLIAQES